MGSLSLTHPALGLCFSPRDRTPSVPGSPRTSSRGAPIPPSAITLYSPGLASLASTARSILRAEAVPKPPTEPAKSCSWPALKSSSASPPQSVGPALVVLPAQWTRQWTPVPAGRHRITGLDKEAAARPLHHRGIEHASPTLGSAGTLRREHERGAGVNRHIRETHDITEIRRLRTNLFTHRLHGHPRECREDDEHEHALDQPYLLRMHCLPHRHSPDWPKMSRLPC